MIKSYLKTAFRFLLKNKTFSFINIFGLAAGTLCCLYILLYVQQQYSYDKQHVAVDRIYRITTDLLLPGDKHHNASSSPPIAPAIKTSIPGVENFTRVVKSELLGAKEHLLRYKEKSFYQTGALFVDSTFFDIFTYKFIEGQSKNALSDPYDIVLTQGVAKKLFGKQPAVGKMVNINDAWGKHDFKITGVVDESLGKSHIEGDMFVNIHSGRTANSFAIDNEWAGDNFLYTYIKLSPGVTAANIESKLPGLLKMNGSDRFRLFGMKKSLHLQPVSSIHTTAGLENELSQTANPSFLLMLGLIAVLIQVIACINFMNLSTARASKRAKEVGVRKVVGAGKYDLVQQFLGESFLLAFIGIIIALPLLYFCLPLLNDITRSDIHLSFFADYRLWLMLAGLVVVTGLLAGSYPAFYLSAFEAIKVIKGNFNSRISAAGIRKSLVVFQFSLSIVMITGILVIYSQLNYIKSKDLGFDKSQKLILSFYTNDSQLKIPALTDDLKQLADVKSISSADNYISQYVMHDHGVYADGGNMANSVDAQNIASDQYFVKANNIKLLSGRDFMYGDSNKVLINETLARRLNLNPQTAPGARLYTKYGDAPASFVTVAGVMKDFNYTSLHEQVKPFMLIYDSDFRDFNSMTVSVSSGDYKKLLSEMSAVWSKNLPAVPFEYTFLDDEVQKQYATEVTLSQIINSFTLIAIIISCLGLFGLAAFSAEQRSKEIGIRKVLGASVSGIVGLLSADFLKLVVISFVIATPIAAYGMNKWLQAFAYRVSLSWWIFALAGVMALIIAFVTVSSQAIKAGLMKPVKSLKAE